jgi:hypothetical protein
MKWQILKWMKVMQTATRAQWRARAVLLVVFSLLVMSYPGSAQQQIRTPNQQTPARAKQAPEAKKRKLVKPKDPEAMALFMHLLERYANNAADKSEMDLRLERKLAKSPGSRAAIKRLVEKFRKIPAADRQQLLGSYANISPTMKIPKQRYEASFSRAARTVRQIPKLDRFVPEEAIPVSPGPLNGGKKGLDREPIDRLPRDRSALELEQSFWPLLGGAEMFTYAGGSGPYSGDGVAAIYTPFTPWQAGEYRLTYTGLRCRDETFYDGGTNSDEIYIITSVLDPNDRDRAAVTTKHPQGDRYRGDDYYTELDDGNVRQGPNRNVWHSNQWGGGARDLLLVVSVFEQDFGDPDETKEEVSDAIEAARELCDGCPGWLEFVLDALDFLVDNVFSFEDDLIERVERRIDAQDIPEYVGERNNDHRLRTYEHDGRAIRYHFRTRHNANEGADYRVYFRFNQE